jgi:hypothetical protein
MVEPLLSGIVLGLITVSALVFLLLHFYSIVVVINLKFNFSKILQIRDLQDFLILFSINLKITFKTLTIISNFRI